MSSAEPFTPASILHVVFTVAVFPHFTLRRHRTTTCSRRCDLSLAMRNLSMTTLTTLTTLTSRRDHRRGCCSTCQNMALDPPGSTHWLGLRCVTGLSWPARRRRVHSRPTAADAGRSGGNGKGTGRWTRRDRFMT
ncbi:hypothetical protein P152DRAFT_21398 [Eremomyces bilateralis CBS 781.70]|uniref:Uncharacterized protein n=1 Tax=Eremomyces bilateralis CBS 781.70 TaxID=1392243 RepID=A0A6G1GHC8_9PEZI|nr:uncharacterized protein P152DRAFT_21398 [Eremomyces bilateralis CBS 781.70]KAF1817505.1 hypothetical protein P152DRAFT_21398 [Eremomyces bilateralis CBS 781.70]